MSKRAELRRAARQKVKDEREVLFFHPDWETRFKQHAMWCGRCKNPTKLMKRGCRNFDRLIRDYYMEQRNVEEESVEPTEA